MQHLDHDMDDLFRKAGEDYPLKTEVDDWDKLAGKMLYEPDAMVTGKKRSKVYIILLVSLIACMILGGLFYYNTPGHLIKQTTTNHTTLTGVKRTRALKKQAVLSTEPGKENILQAPSAVAEKKVVISESSNSRTKKDLLLKINTGIKNNKHHSNKLATAGNEYSFNNIQNAESAAVVTVEQMHSLQGSVVKKSQIDLSYSIYESKLTPATIKVSVFHSKDKKGFYLGLNGGPELSKIGSQTNTKTGYHAGFVVGYNRNSRWSIESGVLIGENNYYSKGSYFNMNKMSSSMPAGMEILTLDGQRKHVEIPVVGKYNFVHRLHSDFFFTGGIISDLYLQEKNYYQTMLNGVKDNQMGLYNNKHFSLASELRISIGYEHPLGRSGSFRIEPYKNIPIKRSGMGSMSVFSSGFNVGLVHFFGR